MTLHNDHLVLPTGPDQQYSGGATVDSQEDKVKALGAILTVLMFIQFQAHAQDGRKPVAKKNQNTGLSAGTIFKDCDDCPEMVAIPPGSFDMGSHDGDDNEKPLHRVTIDYAFALGKTEVTQGQWEALMGSNPSKFSGCGDNCPVEQVSWDNAQEFIEKLNTKTGQQYRLPSEAEWEYACRAGGRHTYCGNDDPNSIGWYGGLAKPAGNSGESTNPVATKQANAWGLYDMSGNVWEWVEDNYHKDYSGAPTDGSAWQNEDSMLYVPRGGSWSYLQRASKRGGSEPDYRFNTIGFRLARSLP
jgi:formylglycine-generating enzyme required for sulfatase activity